MRRRCSERVGQRVRAAGRGRPRVDRAPYQVGWCSWYHYFDDVTEADVRANLRSSRRLAVRRVPGRRRLPGRHRRLADHRPTVPLRRSTSWPPPSPRPDARPGIWIAPFLAAPDSEVATDHPDWLARYRRRRAAARRHVATPCGGGRDGFMHALDTTHPEVLAPPRAAWPPTRRAPASPTSSSTSPSPRRRRRVATTPRCTPAERVRAGYDAIRRGAGDDAFLLGCGVPLGARGRRGRRQPHRRRRRAAVARSATATPAVAGYEHVRAGHRSTRGREHADPGASCTAGCGSTIPTA